LPASGSVFSILWLNGWVSLATAAAVGPGAEQQQLADLTGGDGDRGAVVREERGHVAEDLDYEVGRGP